MGKFRGAERAPKKEVGLKFTMAEMLQNALRDKGIEAAKQEVAGDLEEDRSRLREVGGTDASAEIQDVNREYDEALLDNALKAQVAIDETVGAAQEATFELLDTEEVDKGWDSLSPAERRRTFRVVEGGGDADITKEPDEDTVTRAKIISEEPSTKEVDEGWEKMRIKSEAPSTEDLDQAWDEPAYDSTEMRRTLRGGFEPVVIEGGKGQTVIAEQGPTGTLIGDPEEIAKNAGAETAEVAHIDESPSIDVGEGYLSAEELEELDKETTKELKSEVAEYEGVSLREALEEDQEIQERKKEIVDEPLSLREMMEREAEETETVPPPPAITPEGGVDLEEEAERAESRKSDEAKIMSLLDEYARDKDRDEVDLDEIIERADTMAEDFKNNYGEEEYLAMRQRFAEKLDAVFNAPAREEEKPPVITPEAEGARSLREVQEDDDFNIIEGAAIAGAAAAAAKVIEKPAKTVEMPAREALKNEIMDTPNGVWHESFAKGDLDEKRWQALLTQDEKRAYKELQLDIMDQEEHLENLKQAKSVMEKVLRNELGDQFEVSARAQKMMREKAGQIAKVEALLMRSKREQGMLIEKAKSNKAGMEIFDIPQVSDASASRLRDKKWELEEFPAKTSWWKEHPRLRKAAIAGGVVGGGLLFAGAWVASKVLSPIFHPFKTLEFLGNAANKVFKFLERSIVKGDPIGAVQDSVKSAERFFGEKMQKAEAKQKKGVNYATTE